MAKAILQFSGVEVGITLDAVIPVLACPRACREGHRNPGLTVSTSHPASTCGPTVPANSKGVDPLAASFEDRADDAGQDRAAAGAAEGAAQQAAHAARRAASGNIRATAE